MKIAILPCLEILFVSICYAKLCSEKLLDDKNKVPDSAFSESSYKDDYMAKWARESPNNEMAWCPKNTISDIKEEHLKIDLGTIYVLKMIMTKGLSRHGYKTASYYSIEYKREENEDWIKYREKGKEKTIKGNKDHLTEKYDSLDPSIIARWIRIYPRAESSVRVCLILQIYGCVYSSNIMEYRMNDGNSQYGFSDFNYDGLVSSDNYLSNGLGKLVTILDTKVDNPLDSQKEHLVGWSRSSLASDFIEIVFRFDAVRNFTALNIETSNHLVSNVQTFSKIEILFSLDGSFYDQSDIISIFVQEDAASSYFKYITTDLKHRIGKFSKVKLLFRSNWIVIRRVEFDSEVSNNYIPQRPRLSKGTAIVTQRPIAPFVESDFFSIPLAYTLVIVISILIIMLLIGIPCVTIFIRRQKDRNKKCKEALQRHFQEEHARFLSMTQQQYKDSMGNSGLFTVSNFNPSISNMNNRIIQESSIYTSLGGSDSEINCPSDKQQYMTPNFAMLNTCPIINPVSTNKNPGLTNDYSAMSFMTLASSGPSYMPYYSSNAQLARSQMNLRSHCDKINSIFTFSDIYPDESTLTKSISMRESIKMSIQGPVGNSRLYCSVTPPDILLVSSLNQLKISSAYSGVQLDNLKYIKNIGQGNFGNIHIAEWTVHQEIQYSSGKKYVSHEYNSLRESLTSSIETENGPNVIQETQFASVKVLSKDAPTKIKREFYQEIKYLMSLNHKNFVSILNLHETSLGGCVVVSEYTALQDAFTYLQSFNFSDSNIVADDQNMIQSTSIGQSKLLYMASQVASAMKHLEARQMVHCDLACRNLLVMNHQLHIKITDLAMSQQKFSSDYALIDNFTSSHLHKSESCLLQNQTVHSCQNPDDPSPASLLPIRWMSWQSLIKGEFTNKSDVYSFGVMLWELLTVCQKQPYNELTNEQIMINCNLHAHKDCRARTLSFPKTFSIELRDFITHCTSSDENKRPNFIEIDMFLQHKTVGCQLFTADL